MIIMVAVWMASAIALVMLVIEVGHWFEHRRHLQMQVDAGAFAGGSAFNGCVVASGADRNSWTSTANAAIESHARKFAGDTVNVASAVNRQVSNSANVAIRINATKYANEGGLDKDDLPPCQSGYVDVKGTESSLPWFFANKVVPTINAHARVSVLQLATLSGSLPLAVEDVNPLAAGALVVDETVTNFKTTASAVLGRQALTPAGTTVLNGQSLTPWTGGPVGVSISSTDNGVVIALCSNSTICGGTHGAGWLNGTVNAVCTQLYVTCVSGNQTGLEFIHGYSTTGTGSASAPILRSVTLTKGGTGACTDDSAPYFMLNGGCKVGVDAQLDFGVTGDPSRNVNQGGLNASVSVGSCNLAYTASTGTTSSWSAANCQTIDSGAGQTPLALNWQTGSGSTKKSGTFNQVARPFANDGATATQSYPIAYAQISQGADCAGGVANSLPYASHNLCVGIGVFGNLKVAADANDPTRLLKFIGGSHTGAINCGGTNLRDDIRDGCLVSVQKNPGEACPNVTLPVDCLPLRTGGKVGQVRQGMDDRFIVNGVCPPNHWPTTPSSVKPDIPGDDPRAVPLIITLYGAFAGSGSGYVPVTDFATFYVTGWDSQSNACDGINQSPPPGADQGTVWGHFITYVGDLGNSTGGATCTFSTSALAPCIAVLTE